jgi:hypothetical protein
VGPFIAFKLGKNGMRHVAYQDQNEHLVYGRNTGMAWEVMPLDTDPLVGSNVSLALDSKGHFHVSYLDLKWTRLKYATDTAGVPAIAVLDQGLVGWFTSVAVGPDGRTHVSYRDTKHGTAQYAFCDNNCQLSSTWTLEVIDDVGDAGKFTALTIDHDGTPYVAYSVADEGAFKMAHRKDGVWNIDTVAAGGQVGWCTSATTGPDNGKYLSYVDKVDGMLRFASYLDGSWNSEPVAPAPIGEYAGQKTSIAMDPLKRVHIAWSDDAGLGVHYAWCPTLCDGLCCDEWQVVMVDPNVKVGQGVALVLNAAGTPEVGYVTGDGSAATFVIAIGKCAETPVDANCDGVDGVDFDGDGFASIGSGGTDCDDNDPEAYPGHAEIEFDNIDSNCDGKD